VVPLRHRPLSERDRSLPTLSRPLVLGTATWYAQVSNITQWPAGTTQRLHATGVICSKVAGYPVRSMDHVKYVQSVHRIAKQSTPGLGAQRGSRQPLRTRSSAYPQSADQLLGRPATAVPPLRRNP
jgi:hypothetical protein